MDAKLAPHPSKLNLFCDFALIGAMGFGGVLPWARYMMVVKRGWMDETAFTELFTLGQFFPGPNIANCGVIYGRRTNGPMGACLAVLGLYLFPTITTISAGLLIGRYWRNPDLQQVFGAVMPTASGLMLGTTLRLVRGVPRYISAFLALGITFLLMAFTGLPLWLVLLICIPVSLAFSYTRRYRHGA